MVSDWKRVAILGGTPEIRAVRASEKNYGLIGTRSQPQEGDAIARLKASRASIFRATPEGVTPVFEGPGWIQAIDGVSDTWFAVRASLHGDSGSDYFLLRSLDGGRTWEERGAIYARSLARVLAVDDKVAWVLGAKVLSMTTTGGREWSEIKAPGERNAIRETLAQDGAGGVLLLGPGGVLVTRDEGASFTAEPVPGPVHDHAHGLYVVTVNGVSTITAPHEAATPFAEHRLPLRLAVAANTWRVLSRGANPEKPPRMGIHRTDDAGKTWSRQEIPLSPSCDIAGRDFGLGLDAVGAVYVGGG